MRNALSKECYILGGKVQTRTKFTTLWCLSKACIPQISGFSSPYILCHFKTTFGNSHNSFLIAKNDYNVQSQHGFFLLLYHSSPYESLKEESTDEHDIFAYIVCSLVSIIWFWAYCIDSLSLSLHLILFINGSILRYCPLWNLINEIQFSQLS